MEQGSTFRSSAPPYPTADPDYRVLARQRSRFTHYHFYLRDEILGAMVMRVASFFPFHTSYWLNGHHFIEQELNRQGVSFRKNDNAFRSVSDPEALQAAADRLTPEVIRQRLEYWTLVLGPKFFARERQAMNPRRLYALRQVEYCRNFIFKRHFPIHRLFERSCELGVWRWTADHFSQVFGTRLTRRLRGKLHTTLDKIEPGHDVFRAYWKNSLVKQYEKFLTFLRMEVCSNNLADWGLKKGLPHLDTVRGTFPGVLDRFTGFEAQAPNVHVDFAVFQRLALPVACGVTKIPPIKIHDTRMVRLLEVLLHGSTTLRGWTTPALHQALLTTYALSAQTYRVTQLRYDLRKLKAHGLLQRHGRHYAYRLTDKGLKVALLFTLFHQRICGPLAHSLFHHRPDPHSQPASKLEAAYNRADDTLQHIIHLVEAARTCYTTSAHTGAIRM
jgi:hypothetical protein